MFACEKSNDDAKTPNITLKIIDIETWSAENPNCDPVSGAVVEIYDMSTNRIPEPDGEVPGPDFELSTDENGKVTFYGGENVIYGILVENENLTNLMNPETINNRTVGYSAINVFQVEDAEMRNGLLTIVNQPYYLESNGDTIFTQPHAQPGDPQIEDDNYDGVIDSYDKLSRTNIKGLGEHTIYVGDRNRVIR